MYRQIVVHPQDRDLQRILWRYSSEEPIQEYRLTTVTYGTSSAPFLATRCLKKLADDNKNQYPRAAQVLSSDFYVDDLLSGTSTIEDVIKMQKEISSLLQTAGLTLRKWASNHSTFLDTIPKVLQEHNHHYPWIMKMESQHLNYDGILKMTSCKSRATLPRCNHQTPQRAQNTRC
jgi:hypothetical protein